MNYFWFHAEEFELLLGGEHLGEESDAAADGDFHGEGDLRKRKFSFYFGDGFLPVGAVGGEAF